MFSSHVFAPKIARGKQILVRPWQEMCRSDKEYRNVWFVIYSLSLTL